MPWDQDLDPNSPAYGIASSQARFNRVVAGPGTGKSFALKRRVARLLEEGADPKRILPVTFTNVQPKTCSVKCYKSEFPVVRTSAGQPCTHCVCESSVVKVCYRSLGGSLGP
jgi:hypothetical protein